MNILLASIIQKNVNEHRFLLFIIVIKYKRNSEDTLTKGIPRGTGGTLNYPLPQEQQRFNFSKIFTSNDFFTNFIWEKFQNLYRQYL